MVNSYKPSRKRDDLATIVADIHGVTADYVRKVRNGERENEEILATYMDILEGKTALIEAVKKTVPIHDNKKD